MEHRPGFWPAVALTLAGHAAVLGYFGTRAPEPGLAGVAAPAGQPFQVRVVPAPRPASEQPEAMSAAAPALPAAPAAPPAARQEPAAGAAPSRQPAPQPASGSESTTVSAAAPSPEPAYLRRGELTVPPRLITPVQVAFPEDVLGFVDLKVQLTLFIDEQGVVQRVRVENDVHPSFVRAVQESFGSARFAPGELDRLPVRAQVRLEVEFHSPSRRRS
ncbi:MAG TPA: energy transducer TonB [Ramlibacter sp.]|nr:energy transducer TonB [Ramlibacter sp.]